MIEVQLREYLLTFQEDFKQALLKHELYGIPEFDSLLSSMTTIVTSAEVNEELFLPIEEHKIDKYGLAEATIRLANTGYTHKKIAETLTLTSGFGIVENEVREWVNNYSSLKLTKKQKVHGNLFEVQDRMQEIYMQLMNHLDLIKSTDKEDFWKAKVSKEQVILDVFKELRQLTKEAKEVLKSIDHQSKMNEFRKIVLETIRKIDPSTARIIVEKLEQDKAVYSALLPPD